MASIEIDLSEVERLSARVTVAALALVPGVREVVKRGALNVKNDTRKAISTHPTWKSLAATVNYDLRGSNAVVASAVVGYDDEGQGELAGIAEFGSSRHAPHPALMPAAKAEAPRFEKALLDVVTKALDL